MNFDQSYITVKGWMATKLNLSGNKLLAFALIYGFSQDGQSEFKGSLNYIAKWLGCSRRTAVNVVNSLEEDNLIVKKQTTLNKVTRNFFFCQP